MTIRTYILAVVALTAIAFGLLFAEERDIALIFFGILAGFFTNILGVKENQGPKRFTKEPVSSVEDDQLDIILGQIQDDESTRI